MGPASLASAPHTPDLLPPDSPPSPVCPLPGSDPPSGDGQVLGRAGVRHKLGQWREGGAVGQGAGQARPAGAQAVGCGGGGQRRPGAGLGQRAALHSRVQASAGTHPSSPHSCTKAPPLTSLQMAALAAAAAAATATAAAAAAASVAGGGQEHGEPTYETHFGRRGNQLGELFGPRGAPGCPVPQKTLCVPSGRGLAWWLTQGDCSHGPHPQASRWTLSTTLSSPTATTTAFRCE